MSLIIKQLDSNLLDDFLDYFDNVAFTDNPGWSKCYCQFYHFEGKRNEWLHSTSKQNRNAAIDMITSGHMNGFIAYKNNM